MEKMSIKITSYDALCNLGNSIDAIYEKAINGDVSCFENLQNYLNDNFVHAGLVHCELSTIDNPDFNIRCNKLILKNLKLIKKDISKIISKYGVNRIGIVAASTNAGAEEFEKSENPKHYELGNPACFLREYLNLNGYYTTVSTACSSGIKAFSLARDLIWNKISDAVIVVCVDSFAKVPVFGFASLEILSNKPSLPFSKNRSGMNIGEACSMFILENTSDDGIEVMGIGESSDIYHSTTPDPDAEEAIKAIEEALKDAQIKPSDVDYINAHGTGTLANDLMEASAISRVFGNSVPVSSTKPLTGHCLGAAAGIETALCCKLVESFDGKLYPHIYDGNYDIELPKIKLVAKSENYKQCKICLCNSFGFGGTNAILVIGKRNG